MSLMEQSSDEHHRPFSLTHRNPGGEDLQTQNGSAFQPKLLQTAHINGDGEAHRPFPPEKRNPDPTAAGTNGPHRPFGAGVMNPETSSQAEHGGAAKVENKASELPRSVDAVGESKQEPHRPFSPEHRNPTLIASGANGPHRPFATGVRNPESNSAEQQASRSTDAVGESRQEPHRAFEAGYRNSEISSANRAHQPFPVQKRNPLEGTSSSTVEEPRSALELKADSTALPRSADTVGQSKEKPHLPFTTSHRNADLQPNDEEVKPHRPFAAQHRNTEAEVISTHSQSGDAQQSSPALRTQFGNIDSRTNSPAVSEKSFATADGGSSGVHISSEDDVGTAGNGEALAPMKDAGERHEGVVASTSQSPPGTSGSASGKSIGDGKKEKGLLKGLKNSLRRSRV